MDTNPPSTQPSETPQELPTPLASSDVAPAPVAPQTPKKNHVAAIVLSVVGGVVLLAIIALVLLYNLWYQNPDKIVTDAFTSLTKVKTGDVQGSATIETSDVKMVVNLKSKAATDAAGGNAELKITMKSGELKDKVFSLTADGVFQNDGTIYVRANNVAKVVDDFLDVYLEQAIAQYPGISDADIAEYKSQASQALAPTVRVIDSRWIKISPDDLKSSDSNTPDTQKCVSDALALLRNDASASREVANVYKQNKFVVVKDKLGVQNGNYGFVLDIDNAKSKAFGDAVRQTKFGSALTKCEKDSTSSSSDNSSSDTTSRVTVWVSKYTHELKHVTVDVSSQDDTKVNLDLATNLNKPEQVEIPQNATPFSEIRGELNSVTSAFGAPTL